MKRKYFLTNDQLVFITVRSESLDRHELIPLYDLTDDELVMLKKKANDELEERYSPYRDSAEISDYDLYGEDWQSMEHHYNIKTSFYENVQNPLGGKIE